MNVLEKNMELQQIHSALTDIFRRVFNDPNLQLQDSMTAKDVAGWDSLNHIVLISEIETQFKIKFKLRELLNMESVGDLLRLLGTKTDAVTNPRPV